MSTVTDIPRVFAYRVGLCAMSVCAAADVERDEIEREMNMSYPTGISSRWQVSEDAFSGGEPNPCPCPDEPDSRRHWLLEC